MARCWRRFVAVVAPAAASRLDHRDARSVVGNLDGNPRDALPRVEGLLRLEDRIEEEALKDGVGAG